MVPMHPLPQNSLPPQRAKLLSRLSSNKHPLPEIPSITVCHPPSIPTLLETMVATHSTDNSYENTKLPSKTSLPHSLNNLNSPSMLNRFLLTSHSSSKLPPSTNTVNNSSHSSNRRMLPLNPKTLNTHSTDKVETISTDLNPKNLPLSNRSLSNSKVSSPLMSVPTTLPSVDSVSNLSYTVRVSNSNNSIISNSPAKPAMPTLELDSLTTRTLLVDTPVPAMNRSQLYQHPPIRLPPLFSSPNKVSTSRTSITRNLVEVWATIRMLHTTLISTPSVRPPYFK